MVNAKRISRKLPALLTNGNTTQQKHYNEAMKNRYRLFQFKKRSPERYASLMNKIITALTEMDQELSDTVTPKQNSLEETKQSTEVKT